MRIPIKASHTQLKSLMFEVYEHVKNLISTPIFDYYITIKLKIGKKV